MRSVRAESYRQIRTNLQFMDLENPVQVLVVASSLAGEGKSTTATNLAMITAETGRRVLLIEADMRRPRVSDYLGLERAIGLSNVLVGQVAVTDVMQPWGTDGLMVLPCGSIPPNPSELLGSHQMVDLIDELRGMFDLIVIDTPPLLPVTDAAVASTRADGVIVVVRYGKTSRNHLNTTLQSLDAVDARILGCVLSMVPRKGSDSGYEGYAYYNDEPKKRRGASKGGNSDPEDAEPVPWVLPPRPLPVATDDAVDPAAEPRHAESGHPAGSSVGIGGADGSNSALDGFPNGSASPAAPASAADLGSEKIDVVQSSVSQPPAGTGSAPTI
jgi:capsular exopolysaccharide synthesis family protein